MKFKTIEPMRILMKNTVKRKTILLAISVSFLSQIAFAVPQLQASNKSTPDVTFDKVEAIFGHNINTTDTSLKTFLLAIGLDHTSMNSPNKKQNIGIPFIVDGGPNYWVSRLTRGEQELEVLVNNALLLLFTKEDIPNRKKSAFKLLMLAAEQGYWPADYYIAEFHLANHLTRDYSKLTPLADFMDDSETKAIARDTMIRYNRCSEIGFAPCQYRIGFWLASASGTLKQGLGVLRTAIATTLIDTRYEDTLDAALFKAAKEIVLKGEEAGLDEVVREHYSEFIEKRRW